MATEAHGRMILDPSVIFSDEVLAWLEDKASHPYVVGSSALVQKLSDPEALSDLRLFDERVTPDRIQHLRGSLDRFAIQKFSWREFEGLQPGAVTIRDALIRSNEPLADVLADEWVFLVSQSLGIVSGARRTLGAFHRAGAEVLL